MRSKKAVIGASLIIYLIGLVLISTGGWYFIAQLNANPPIKYAFVFLLFFIGARKIGLLK